MMKVIFLDIDGVLNCQTGYVKGFCKYVEWVDVDGTERHHQSFYPPSKDLLNKLIRETDAKIVISSTWRRSGIDFMRKVWEIEGMEGEIIDITPSLHIDRGIEIKAWLSEHKFYHINWDPDRQVEIEEKSGIENYIIIDDDSDMLYNQRNHFIHVFPSPRNKDGFTQEHYERSLVILSKTVSELTYS